MKDIFKLIDIICRVYDNPYYKPKEGFTFCNLAAQDIVKEYGCLDFDNKPTNAIAQFLFTSPSWSEVAMKDAQTLANTGVLLFAVQVGDPHGHICVIRPGLEKPSGKWGKAPSCMNIGQLNFISKGVNWAFVGSPRIFAYKSTL